jgi:hypothetical protein
MKQFNKPLDNMGGVLKIWAVPPADITISENVVTFSKTTDIVVLYASPGSMSFTEKQKDGAGGTFFDVELNGFIPNDSKETSELIAYMCRRRWMVIYIDQNENYKVAGTVTNPLRVGFDLDTGSDTPNRNGHAVKFYGKQLQKSIFINNPFAV